MEVVYAASGEPAKAAVVHLEREFGYVLHFKRNVSTLRDMKGRLAAAIIDVQTLITAALNNDELIRQRVQDWLSRAGSVQDEVNQLIAEAGHVNSWFKGWCCSRFSFGRNAEKKNAVIQGLLDERSAIGDTVSDPKPFQALPILLDCDYNVFASREIVMNQVIEALRNEKISLVGVHGMPGVGKTMLIKAIAKQVKEEKLFEEVVIVIVSQNPVLEKVQGDIANGLGVNLPERDTSIQIAARMWERLNKRKAVLIVLDDVWERLQLAEVGIPLKSNDSGCKVVFTTRYESVCNQMEAGASFGVPVLTEKDSWILFCQKVGNVVDSVVPVSLARDLVSECMGLPLAIATLGLTLKNNNEVAAWRYVLMQLKKSMFEGFTPVFGSIILSYDFLRNETAKLCFLFCSLFPEDSKIDTEDLLKYLIGEDLLRTVDSVEESRELLQSLVTKLVSSNLLLIDEDLWPTPRVMMHDVVRDVAISIASKDEKLGFIVKAGMVLADWPNVKLGNCKRLSAMKNKFRCVLPYKIQAPQLLTLSMRDNKDLVEIPDDFFNEMGNLLTLDMSATGISSLPPSLSRLVNLRTLLIERCKFEDIYLIEDLEKLEIFSFNGSEVRHPFEIDTGKLRNLKLLNLSFSSSVSAKKFVNMSQLEELSMHFTSSVDGVVSLTRLTSLKCSLPTIHLFDDLPNLEKLIRFVIVCFDEFRFAEPRHKGNYLFRTPKYQRILYLNFPVERFPLANWVLVLIARTEYLVLEEGESTESVGELDGTGLNDLKYLRVNRLQNMKYLMNSMAGKAPNYAFSNLEVLIIERMNSFEAFCRGEFADGFLCKLRILAMEKCSGVTNLIPTDLLLKLHNLEDIRLSDCTRLENLIQFEGDACALVATNDKSTATSISCSPTSSIFPNLEHLHIDNCPQLEYVFQLKVARDLPQLSQLHVTNCAKLKIIIEGSFDEGSSNGEKDTLILPQLRWLNVEILPELSRLCPPGLNIDCPRLEEIQVRDCWKLRKLPFRSDSVPKLHRLFGQQHWYNELEWDDEKAKHLLHKAFQGRIRR